MVVNNKEYKKRCQMNTGHLSIKLNLNVEPCFCNDIFSKAFIGYGCVKIRYLCAELSYYR
ncbi:hypothetical protein BpHYR1_032186 [Brachionus plicatilis]|uniref:Uncharacterized protein n=1 Tax=Brachionus plicatilis TaxID=10195 RepID=A0A3M7RLK1_BRAPC|nr:hypothetical protein BpHYR1_032186 [Brachionus plicatilis]